MELNENFKDGYHLNQGVKEHMIKNERNYVHN